MTTPETRVHAICRECYSLKPNIREPIAIDFPHCAGECCCYCGVGTYLGIYYRDVLKPSKFCGCTSDTVYPYYEHPDFLSRGDRGDGVKSRKDRTQGYYLLNGLPTFDLKEMRDGSVDDYIDGYDEDDE